MTASASSAGAGLPAGLEESEEPLSLPYNLRSCKPLQHHTPAEARASAAGAGGSSAKGMRFRPMIFFCWMFKGGIFKTMDTIHAAVALAGELPIEGWLISIELAHNDLF